MHKKLLFAIIAAIAATNAYSDQVLTSQKYVDDGLATKQDKITAGTTGAVVTYNGTADGQTQFTERAIYDGSATYDSTTDANKLITAGAVNTMTPELPTGTANAAVTYDANGNIGGERRIWDSDSGGAAAVSSSRSDEWLTSVSGVKGMLKYITSVDSANPTTIDGIFYMPVFSENRNTPIFDSVKVANSVEDLGTWNTNKVIPTWTALDSGLATKQNKIPAGTAGNLVTYTGTAGTVGSVATYTGAATYNATNDANKIPTMSGVTAWAQAKKVCIRWLDTPEHPEHNDENCLLWELPD